MERKIEVGDIVRLNTNEFIDSILPINSIGKILAFRHTSPHVALVEFKDQLICKDPKIPEDEYPHINISTLNGNCTRELHHTYLDLFRSCNKIKIKFKLPCASSD